MWFKSWLCIKLSWPPKLRFSWGRHDMSFRYNEVKTFKHDSHTLWQSTGSVISLNIITCENRKYVGSFRVFVCQLICLSVTHFSPTVLVWSCSNFYSSFVLCPTPTLLKELTIFTFFWIQEFFLTFFNMGLIGTFSDFHACSSQISRQNLQKIHTKASLMV